MKGNEERQQFGSVGKTRCKEWKKTRIFHANTNQILKRVDNNGKNELFSFAFVINKKKSEELFSKVVDLLQLTTAFGRFIETKTRTVITR